LDVREMVREVLHDQRLQAELKRQQIWSQVADDLPCVGGDRRLLTQALTNLVDNAIKYTPEEGEIIVRSWEANGEVIITVQDNGIGIPLEFQPHVFDRFYRARQPGTEHISGSGLGLSLVRGIVRQHKGRVWVESAGQAGQGATFGLALPVLHAEEVGKKVDG
jgi:signal transduction histidine kinase